MASNKRGLSAKREAQNERTESRYPGCQSEQQRARADADSRRFPMCLHSMCPPDHVYHPNTAELMGVNPIYRIVNRKAKSDAVHVYEDVLRTRV